MLIGCLSFYEEKDFIRESAESLLRVADKVIAVDGAYRDFPHKIPYSTDGTLDILAALRREQLKQLEVVEVREAWEDEIVKRNRYLIGNEGDYYLMIDADEVIYGFADDRKYSEQPDWQLRSTRLDGVHSHYIHRLFRHRKGLSYFGCHNCLRVGDELIRNPDRLPRYEGLTIRHYTDNRSQKRADEKGEYYRRLYRSEESFRKVNGF